MPLATILLNPQTWDLMVDAERNIAVASPPYSYAQDAACAAKLFLGEYYYDTTIGVPYWQEILGDWPPIQLMKARWVAAALRVPDVVQAQVFVESIQGRWVQAQMQVTDTAGALTVIAFSSGSQAPTTAPATATPGAPSLDFSQAQDSMYEPLI